MNDVQHTALVEQLTAAMAALVENDAALIQLVYTPEEYTNKVLMPIIDRLLSDQEAMFAKALSEANGLVADAYGKGWNAAITNEGIDALLNAVHPEAKVSGMMMFEDMQWRAWITWPWLQLEPPHGTGPTRQAAIADACQKARESLDD